MRQRFSGRGWAAFRSRDFRLFVAARLLYGAATQMQNVAVGWLIYDLTKSAAALGFVSSTVVGLTQVWPLYALIVIAGAAKAFGHPAGQALIPSLVPRED